MSDETIRRYARELERQGLDPREVGAALLRAKPSPVCVLVQARRVDERIDLGHGTPRPVVGVYRPGYQSQIVRERLWAIPVATIEQALAVLAHFEARGDQPILWDTTRGQVAYFKAQYGRDYDFVEEGWPEPDPPRESVLNSDRARRGA